MNQVEGRGDVVAEVIQDKHETGKNTRRPGLQQILDELAVSGGDWDCLTVYRLDRLTRSLADGGRIFEMLREHNRGFLSITENLDFSTPIGRAMMAIVNVFAQFGREQISERTRDRMIQLARDGYWPVGSPPYGYMRGPKGDNVLRPDPIKSQVVLACCEEYYKGATTSSLVRKYKAQGMSKHILLRVLRSPVYIGKLEYAGEVYEGKHVGIVPVELHNACVDLLPKTRHAARPKAQRYPYLLSGLVYCHCGRRMTPETAKGRRYHYYRCTDNTECRQRVKAERIEEAVLNRVKTIQFEASDIRDICREIRAMRKKRLQAAIPEQERRRQALREACRERDKVADAFLNGMVDEANKSYFNRKLVEANALIDELEQRIEELEDLKKQSLGPFANSEALAQTLKNIGDAFRKTPDDPEAKRAAIAAHVKRIVCKDKTTYHIEFNFLSSTNCTVWHPQGDSNPCCRDENPVS